MPRRGTRPLLHPAPVPPYVTGTEQKDRSPGPFRACAGSNAQARRTLRVRGRQGGTRAPARGHAVPADPPVSGMTSWGLAAASAWLQRYGMPAEPAPAPVMRGGAAPAQPVCYGLRPDSARRWTTWREPGRAAVQTPSAPPGRYCLPPQSCPPPLRPGALERRPLSAHPTRVAEAAPRLQPRSPGRHLGFCQLRSAGNPGRHGPERGPAGIRPPGAVLLAAPYANLPAWVLW